ncbi:MAG: RNA polymerase sigma factor, partial [Flavobacteriales bacterium]|nr:RNA polymerase sigma factor [Flavobacteriales bacterium]
AINLSFIKILDHLTELSNVNAFDPWVRSIMRNTLLDEWRKNKRRQEHEVLMETIADNAASDSSYFESDAAVSEEALSDMLTQLPPTTRLVFTLFAIEGFSHKEIAEKMEISTGTTRWHVNEARQQLKQMLEAMHAPISKLKTA